MATYYISPTGNDTTGNGSISTPWQTLAKFLSASATNDTCICRAGTYTFTTATVSYRTVQAYTGETVIFDGASANVRWSIRNTVVLSNLIFQNIYSTDYSILFIDANTTTLSVNGCLFRSCLVGNYTLGLMGVIATAQTISSIIINITSVVINDCYAAGVGTYLHLFGGYSPATYNLTNVTIYLAHSGSGSIVYLFRGSGGGTFYITAKNCIIKNSTGAAVTWSTNATFINDVSYSDLYQLTGAPTGTGVITSDPQFVDPVNGNFKLRPTSPCIDTGTLV